MQSDEKPVDKSAAQFLCGVALVILLAVCYDIKEYMRMNLWCADAGNRQAV